MHSENVWEKSDFIDTPFIVVSGPAGGGKTYLIKEINKMLLDLHLLIKHTTRQPRMGEICDVDYYFVNKNVFDKMINKDTAIAYAYRYSSYYGLSNNEVSISIISNKMPLVILDVHLAIKFKEVYSKSLIIFVSAASTDEVYKRIMDRNDSFDDKEQRMALIEEEIALSGKFDYYFNENTPLLQVREVISNHIKKLRSVPNGFIG